MPDELWQRIAPLLPIEEFRPSGGRPWTPPRRILDGVLYILRTGGRWKAMPREYGSGSTVHRRFQRWVEYDYADAERAVRRRRYRPHIRRRGEERRACRRGTRARRWVVERTTSWFNRCRKLLIRWEKKPHNYLALVHFAATLLIWRHLVG